MRTLLSLGVSVLLATAALAGCEETKPTGAAPAASSAASATPAVTVAAAAASPAAIAAAVPTSFAEPAGYDIDPGHSEVGFSVKHMMVTNVHGSFGKFAGGAYIDEKNPEKSTLAVDIDTSTITTANADRDKHLKSADFFDVAKFPKMTFKSTKVERDGAGYKVTGDLTIKDVTKSVVLNVDALSGETKDPFAGAMHRGAHASTKINRLDFGLKWNKAIETGGAVVGDEVTIDLNVELIKKK
ncbi:MAG TPA: YceI family protein [Polyangiaceae bacterium]